jgi:hypothetical protein
VLLQPFAIALSVWLFALGFLFFCNGTVNQQLEAALLVKVFAFTFFVQLNFL